MGNFKTEYDGFKMQQFVHDDISDQIAPIVRRNIIAWHKTKDITSKKLVDDLVKLMKSKLYNDKK